MFQDKKVLVTGGTGMIGRYLVDLLIEAGAKVRIAAMDDPSRAHPEAEYLRINLLQHENCAKACEGMEYVFHLAGIKGSPAMTKQQPASFFVPTMLFNLNMMEAARVAGVQKYMFTSSVGVYSPNEVFYEDDVWKTFPSENDRFAGWAKRMGELQAQAYEIEHNWKDVYIVRPANVYGPYDNFDPKNSMVIPSLIHRALTENGSLVVWGDGSPIRDFIHAKDVAIGMIKVFESGYNKAVNLGCGEGVAIRDAAEQVVRILKEDFQIDKKLEWDTSKPKGDAKRLLDMERASSLGFQTTVSLYEGIRETMHWYAKNRETVKKTYNVFHESTFV